jgi:hypothetical protein
MQYRDTLDAQGKPIIVAAAHVTAPGVEVMSRRIARGQWFE